MLFVIVIIYGCGLKMFEIFNESYWVDFMNLIDIMVYLCFKVVVECVVWFFVFDVDVDFDLVCLYFLFVFGFVMVFKFVVILSFVSKLMVGEVFLILRVGY